MEDHLPDTQLPPVAVNGNMTSWTQGQIMSKGKTLTVGKGASFCKWSGSHPPENCLVPKRIILEYSTTLKPKRRFKTEETKSFKTPQLCLQCVKNPVESEKLGQLSRYLT